MMKFRAVFSVRIFFEYIVRLVLFLFGNRDEMLCCFFYLIGAACLSFVFILSGGGSETPIF